MSERPGVDANSSKERVETSDDLPGRILSVIYVGEAEHHSFLESKGSLHNFTTFAFTCKGFATDD